MALITAQLTPRIRLYNLKQQTTMNKILARLKEKTTWQGFIAIAALAGLQLSPENADLIVQAGIALAAAILIFTKESK